MANGRRKPPSRRRSETFSFDVGGTMGRATHKYLATVGFYPDGTVGEVFFHTGKAGTDLNIATIELGIAISFALQHGATVEEMREAFPRYGIQPEGALGTLLDLINSYGVQDAVKELLE